MSRDNDRFMIALARLRPDVPDDNIIESGTTLIGLAREHHYFWRRACEAKYPWKANGKVCEECGNEWDDRFYMADKPNTCICCRNKEKARSICVDLRVQCEFFSDPRTMPIILVACDGARFPVPLLW